jgi:hypothetical protein
VKRARRPDYLRRLHDDRNEHRTMNAFAFVAILGGCLLAWWVHVGMPYNTWIP